MVHGPIQAISCPYKQVSLRAGEIVQLAKWLPWSHEDLSSIPQNPCKRPNMMASAYNPGSGEVEISGFLRLSGQIG